MADHKKQAVDQMAVHQSKRSAILAVTKERSWRLTSVALCGDVDELGGVPADGEHGVLGVVGSHAGVMKHRAHRLHGTPATHNTRDTVTTVTGCHCNNTQHQGHRHHCHRLSL